MHSGTCNRAGVPYRFVVRDGVVEQCHACGRWCMDHGVVCPPRVGRKQVLQGSLDRQYTPSPQIRFILVTKRGANRSPTPNIGWALSNIAVRGVSLGAGASVLGSDSAIDSEDTGIPL